MNRGGIFNWGWLLGWMATVTTSPECDFYQEMVVNKAYYVYSPNYPNYYVSSDVSQCRWFASSPPGTTIKLECDDIQMPESEDCRGDSLSVSLSGDAQMRDAQDYCGRGQLRLTSVKNKINIVLHTLPNTTGGSFLCIIEAEPSSPEPSPLDPCECGWINMNRIVGGTTTGVNEYPMMAGLVDVKLIQLYCGATIISPRFVVTAAHCLTDREPEMVAVVVGDHDISSGTETDSASLILASDFFVYPDYESKTYTHDIALVRLSSYIVYRKEVGPACLPFRYRNTTFTGQSVTILGWGPTYFTGPPSSTLKKTVLTVIPLQDCIAALSDNVINNDQICTYEEQTDACQSDSGGPVLWFDKSTGRMQLVGIISYWISCATHKPGVNTRVAAYTDWIQNVTQDTYCIN